MFALFPDQTNTLSPPERVTIRCKSRKFWAKIEWCHPTDDVWSKFDAVYDAMVLTNFKSHCNPTTFIWAKPREKSIKSLSNRQQRSKPTNSFWRNGSDANLFGRNQPQMTKTGNREKDCNFIDLRSATRTNDLICFFTGRWNCEISKVLLCHRRNGVKPASVFCTHWCSLDIRQLLR